MALPPIKLRLDGEEVHLVSQRELERWGGFLNGGRAAWALVSPDNIGPIRRALMCPRHVSTEGVFTELRKQLEDGSALFFEVPPQEVRWDAPPVVDIKELLPTGGDETYGPDRGGPSPGLHWIEIVCVAASGGSFAGARARVRLPGGRSEYVTLDGRSSIRFDDLTEGGTVHFELSGDAVAHGQLQLTGGTRYELGAPIGLSTQRQHVLDVHPNPRAFVSVALFIEDQPVVQGQHTLTSTKGDKTAALDGTELSAEGLALPSTASYAFEQVILPPREADGGDDKGGGRDDKGGGEDEGGGADTGGGGVVAPTQELRLRLRGAEGLGVLLRFDGKSLEATTDEAGLLEVELPEGASEVQLLIPARGEVYTLDLQPHDAPSTIAGAATRLHNLGYYTGSATTEVTPLLREALRAFQRLHGLPTTGDLDTATATALEDAHGS